MIGQVARPRSGIFKLSTLVMSLIMAQGAWAEVITAGSIDHITISGRDIGFYAEDNQDRAILGKASKAEKNGTAVGNTAEALGAKSTAVGSFAKTVVIGNIQPTEAVALGYKATASYSNSTAIASNARANGQDSIAMDNGAQTGVFTSQTIRGQVSLTPADPATAAIAIGVSSTANTMGDIAIGGSAKAIVRSTATAEELAKATSEEQKKRLVTGEKYGAAMAQGFVATATGRNAIALGNNAQAGNAANIGGVNDTIAIGANTVANANRATAIGYHADATGATSVALGYAANAGSQNMVAIGNRAGVGVNANTHGVAIGFEAGTGSTTTSSGTENVAIGRQAGRAVKGNTNYAMGVGTGNNVTGHDNFSSLILAGNRVTGSDNIAIGKMAGSEITANTTVALGAYARGTANNAVAVGGSAEASGVGAIAIGSTGEKQDDRIQSLDGTGNDRIFSNSKLYAQGAVAKGKNSVAIGTDANVNSADATNAIAIGTGATATGVNSISIGTKNRVTANNAGAIGDPSIIAGAGSYTVGNDNAVGSTSTNVGAFGNNNQIGATATYQDVNGVKKLQTANALVVTQAVNNSRAIGNNNYISTSDTYVLGSGIGTQADGITPIDSINATVANSVYLGNDSTIAKGAAVGTKNLDKEGVAGTTTTAGDTGTVIDGTVNGVTYGNFAGATANGAVSVGSAGQERCVMNVAAGEISATSTDAINGSQLYLVAKGTLEQMPVVYTSKDGGKLIKSPNGNFYPAGTPLDAKGEPTNGVTAVAPTDVIASLNNGGNSTTTPMTLTNIQANLADVNDVDDKQPTANSVANLAEKKNNAATVGDVINAGWNIQNNGTDVDAITHANNVNFIDGKGTSVSVTSDGLISEVQVDIETDGTSITTTPDRKLTANTTTLAPTKTGAVTLNNINDAGKLVNAGDIANAINSAGFTLTTSASDGEVAGTSDELISAGKAVIVDAGKNIKIKQDGTNISIATVDAPTFTGGITLGGNPTNKNEPAVNLVTTNTTTPVGVANDVPEVPAINTHGATFTGLAQNLAPTYSTTTFERQPVEVTQSQPIPTVTALQMSNAATLGDVLNAGFNLQNNNTAKDFVKAFDTLNFVDGQGTTAVVETDTDGKVSKIKYDIKADGTTTQITYVTKAGDVVTKNEAGEYVKADGTKVDPSDIAGSQISTVQPKGDNITTNVENGQFVVNTTPLTNAAEGKPNAGSVVVPQGDDAKKLATAGDIANAINNSGFNVTSGNTGSGKQSGTESTELVKPSETVKFIAGDNLDIKQNGQEFTYSLNNNVDLGNAGSLKVGDTTIAAGVVSGLNTTLPVNTTAGTTPVAPVTTNAATLGDVLNAGFNLQNNNAPRDFVKPYDTLNFINGAGTTAVVETDGKGEVSKIKYDTNYSNLTVNGVAAVDSGKKDANGNPIYNFTVATGGTNPVPTPTTPTNPANVTGDNVSVAVDNNVVKAVTGDVTQVGTPEDNAAPVFTAEKPDALVTGDTVAKTANALVAEGLNFTGNNGTVNLHRNLGTQLVVKGGNDGTEVSDKNTYVEATPDNTLVVKFVEKPKFKQVTATEGLKVGAGNTLVNMTPATATMPVNVAEGKAPISAINMNGSTFNGLAPNLPTTTSVGDAPTTNVAPPRSTPEQLTNAATVGDVLNAGFNLQNNDTAKDFVKPYDTVNFVDGKGTTAVVDSNGLVSNVKYDANYNNLTVNGKKAVGGTDADGNTMYTINIPMNTAGQNGNPVEGDDKTIKVEGDVISAIVSPLKNDAAGKVETPALPNALVNAQTVANAINNSGFNLTTSASAGTVTGTTNELINPSETITVDAGKNIAISQTANKISIATKDDAEFKTVKVGDTVNISKNGIDNGGKKITNVGKGETPTDVATVGQLTKVEAGNNVNVTSKTGANGETIYTVSAIGGGTGGLITVNGDKTINGETKNEGQGNTFVNGQGTKVSVTNVGEIKVDSPMAYIGGNNTAGDTSTATNTVKMVGTNDAQGNLQSVQITNVASGLRDVQPNNANLSTLDRINLASGDTLNNAVNVSDLQGAIGDINNNINQLGYRLGDIENNANAGISAAMATAALPQAYLPGKSMISGGMASYNGQGAVAVGISKLSDNGRWVIKVNGTADSQGNAGGAVGAGFHW
ncbi:YadA-like family protein [Faucicola boevrei]|uniref:YadA-like family protein n=1 Tax=Faucicola boevrei TaxID=346665 RepID=UPI0012E9C95D|nr:YadA-like family protein [Moraxella boevrei]